MDIYNLQEMYNLSNEPNDGKGYNQWVLQEGILSFLTNEIEDEYFIIYTVLPHVFINTVFIPSIELNEANIDNLRQWSFNPYSCSWSFEYSKDDISLITPLSSSGSSIIEEGEFIISARSMEGLNDGKSYYEINQKLCHTLDLHYWEDKNSWCKYDKHGDVIEVIKIIDCENLHNNETSTIICAKKKELIPYLSVLDFQLIRMFDITRYRSGEFHGWAKERSNMKLNESQLIFGELSIAKNKDSYSRGIQVIDLRKDKELVAESLWNELFEDPNEKKYCSYIANDLKNEVISEITCNPECLANYFTESDLPFEITPAFFKPEVLLKYKSDRDKYSLRHRSIDCRGSWNLKSYDINPAGQVHAYLIDLSRLPYEEQLHWKQYNENPKGNISERAFTTDFLGKFYDAYLPLESLKNKLEKLDDENVHWWKLKNEKVINKVNYPFTDSNDEWADEILNLDQLLNEGFQEKWLRKMAKSLNCSPDNRFRSLKLLELILIKSEFEKEHAKEIMTPFHTVHNLRSILKGHISGYDAKTERSKALREYGTYRKHFEALCEQCDESIEIIIDMFKTIIN